MASVDISKFKTSDWMKIGGAVAFFIFGFFHWVTAEAGFASDNKNVFGFFWTGTLPWILIMATGVVTFLLAAGMMKAGTFPWALVMLAASALAVLLVLIRLIFNPIDHKSELEALGVDIGRGIGLIICTIAAIVVLAGAFMAFKESGGELSDLKDMNKLKASFQGAGASGDTAPPPPPPPGMTPPPPPPPPA